MTTPPLFKKVVEILQSHLTQEEFLTFELLLDDDDHAKFYREVMKAVVKIAPDWLEEQNNCTQRN